MHMFLLDMEIGFNMALAQLTRASTSKPKRDTLKTWSTYVPLCQEIPEPGPLQSKMPHLHRK